MNIEIELKKRMEIYINNILGCCRLNTQRKEITNNIFRLINKNKSFKQVMLIDDIAKSNTILKGKIINSQKFNDAFQEEKVIPNIIKQTFNYDPDIIVFHNIIIKDFSFLKSLIEGAYKVVFLNCKFDYQLFYNDISPIMKINCFDLNILVLQEDLKYF